MSKLEGEHLYKIEFKDQEAPLDDEDLIYTADYLKKAIDLGVVKSATFVGKVLL